MTGRKRGTENNEDIERMMRREMKNVTRVMKRKRVLKLVRWMMKEAITLKMPNHPPHPPNLFPTLPSQCVHGKPIMPLLWNTPWKGVLGYLHMLGYKQRDSLFLHTH